MRIIVSILLIVLATIGTINAQTAQAVVVGGNAVATVGQIVAGPTKYGVAGIRAQKQKEVISKVANDIVVATSKPPIVYPNPSTDGVIRYTIDAQRVTLFAIDGKQIDATIDTVNRTIYTLHKGIINVIFVTATGQTTNRLVVTQ